MGTISGCSHLKLNLKAKIYIHVYVNSTTQRCPNKIIKIFQFEDFCHLPPVSLTPWAANISANFRKNSKRLYWYTQGLGGNWFMKKNISRKSRGTVPLRKFRRERLQSHKWLTESSYITKYFAFPHILGSSSSYMTLQLLPSEFPHIRGKFYILFYQ